MRPSSASDRITLRSISAADDVEAGERLVEDDQLGIVQQRGRQQHLLPHAFRERRQRRVLIVFEAEQFQEALDLRLEHRVVHAAQAADQAQVLRRGEVRVEKRLFGNVAELLSIRRQVFEDRLALPQHVAVARLHQADEHADRGRLAGAVGAEIAEDLPGLGDERGVAQGRQRPVILGQRAGFEHARIRHRFEDRRIA